MIRNPYKAIVSYWNFENTGGHHTDTVDSASFKTPKFNYFVFKSISRWYELIDDWIKFGGDDLIFLFYEELADNPVEEVRKLLLALGLKVDEERLSCLSKHLQGSFHRDKKKKKLREDVFTAEHHLFIDSVIEKVDHKLQKKIGRKLPNYNHDNDIDKHCKM